jgi:hypothetical protein
LSHQAAVLLAVFLFGSTAGDALIPMESVPAIIHHREHVRRK